MTRRQLQPHSWWIPNGAAPLVNSPGPVSGSRSSWAHFIPLFFFFFSVRSAAGLPDWPGDAPAPYWPPCLPQYSGREKVPKDQFTYGTRQHKKPPVYGKGP